MVFFAAMFLGGLLLSGLALVAISLDKIATQMSRANDLKDSELRASGGAVVTPPTGQN